MENRTTLEYFMSLLDEGERLLSDDIFSEKHQIVEYELREKKEVNEHRETEKDDIDSPVACRGCQAWRGRIRYAEPILSNDCRVMFVLYSPEGKKLLSESSEDYFKKWCSAIGLNLESVSLTSLVKCPTAGFRVEYANACRKYLKAEMESVSPRFLMLLGEDVARYMLGRNLPMKALRGRRYTINNIPTFVTYSPKELVLDRSLRVPIWEDLKLLKEALDVC